ncbi:pyridoxamine 5'-phosphate oxidase family protein [Sphingomonas hankyongi]|uniref:Pyridoxamine 5'-phosphate oxidase family protein n=1 Tax=Sphingomonas hankyongi TaxID=2908209 RepID=A0ABT0S133_9SPHN|nr:pyridoxamine 5'-phosphate oxidase family protein [Sphingomonas hankyongi]MCL6729570.1 pyridoxamine 5'-phosphate oxidase family protein [Sphingomonas hankyongi]
MADLKLEDISEKMRDIDFTILSTRTASGQIAARPMSNNRQVEFDGDSYFFTCEDTGTIRDIQSDANVGLSLQGKSGALGMKPFFITIEGSAELIKDKGRFEEHWTKDLDAWFKEGIDTPGLTLIKVHAQRLHYWDGLDEGEIELKGERAAEGVRSER